MNENIDDDGKLKMRFTNKKFNAQKEGIAFDLSFSQFCQLLREANLTSSDLGNNGYHLARFADSGHYRSGNCRFVHCSVNRAERKRSPAMHAASVANCAKMNIARAARPESEKRSWAIKGGSALKRKRKRPTAKIEDRPEFKIRLIQMKLEGIDPAKHGSIEKLKRLWGVSHTHVRRILRRAGVPERNT